MELSSAQQVFSVFYAIFFGIMLQTIGVRRANPNTNKKGIEKNITHNLFDTPNAWAIGFQYNNKPLWRFLFANLFLNVIPGIIFAFFFLGLASLDKLDLIKIVVLVWLSLIPSNTQRVFMGILILFHDNLYLKKGEYDGFNTQDINAYALLKNERTQYSSHSLFFNHIAIPIFWMFPSVILLYEYLLVPGQIDKTIVFLSWIFVVLGLTLFVAPRSSKS